MSFVVCDVLTFVSRLQICLDEQNKVDACKVEMNQAYTNMTKCVFKLRRVSALPYVSEVRLRTVDFRGL